MWRMFLTVKKKEKKKLQKHNFYVLMCSLARRDDVRTRIPMAQATSLLSLACLASAGTGDYDVLDLPLAERVRLHIFACVFSFLLMAALALADISSLVLPCNWVLVVSVPPFLGLTTQERARIDGCLRLYPS